MTTIDITEVALRTGLTPRALRFYEARGLVRPLRTAAGRRHYSAADVERLAQIVALKNAGFSLAQIARLLAGRSIDLAALVDAQLAALDARADELDAARALLRTAKSRIDRGEPLDAATLCSLIRTGDDVMSEQQWKKVADRYFSPEEQARWSEKMRDVPEGFAQDDYARRWQEMAAKVEAALPLDPASAQAGALYDEWQALLAPFTAVASPEMKAGVMKMYDGIDEWKGDMAPPFSSRVWAFIKEVGARRAAR